MVSDFGSTVGFLEVIMAVYEESGKQERCLWMSRQTDSAYILFHEFLKSYRTCQGIDNEENSVK